MQKEMTVSSSDVFVIRRASNSNPSNPNCIAGLNFLFRGANCPMQAPLHSANSTQTDSVELDVERPRE